MSSYRIVPDGPDKWKVQSKLFGLFWVSMCREIGYGYSEVLTFDTEEAAKGWIDKVLDFDRRNAEWHRQAQERRRSIAPKPYP